jgi:hypothetical protein
MVPVIILLKGIINVALLGVTNALRILVVRGILFKNGVLEGTRNKDARLILVWILEIRVTKKGNAENY